MIDLSVFTHILTDLEGAIIFLIIFLLSFMFMAQITAWVTPPNPKFIKAIALGMGTGAFVVFVIYNYIPLVPALLEGSITGIYGKAGYFWALTILILIVIFGMNTTISWRENKPLEIFK